MTAAHRENGKAPPPAVVVGHPTQSQQQVLKGFDVVGGDGTTARESPGQLFVSRLSAHTVEVAQVVDGELSIVSLHDADLVEVLEAPLWDGGVLAGDSDGWWKVGERHRGVTPQLNDHDGEALAQELVATAEDMNFVHSECESPRVEISQTAGPMGDETHTIVATKLDLARVVVIAQLQPAIRRLTEAVPETTTQTTSGGAEKPSTTESGGLTGLFGYRRLKTIAMDVSPPGRIRALQAVFVLSVLSVIGAAFRIQLFGVTGIEQLVVIGQHLGGASSTIVLGLMAIPVLEAKSTPADTQ
jgi:hypothetical protein